ncbi:endosialidase-like protein [Arcticibacter tournemirensis]|uniref:Tail fiber domain-containing protein n=1 Tax=Arcticibacter tournemirensis TaxID=699437 RepID=A0A5M9HGP5_9SPHI|nr:tail fiber domain-containing protein [Arcticibacter tournemirensis]KAA8485940.1 tail fiber domain-containing protein [Arcticibacter tournemirensis]TQM46801.1 endosialidase-like protein [Arcticibacter tournemirensis]
MKELRWLFVFLVLTSNPKVGLNQTIKQFNGLFNITAVKTVASQYEITGYFTDNSNTFTASNVLANDQIIDPNGTALKISTITSISGNQIVAVCDNTSTNYPSIGMGIIFRPTTSGYPLIANSTPTNILNTALNTSTISIDSDLPSFNSGPALPTIPYVSGDVIRLSSNSSFFKLANSRWSQLTATPSVKFAMTVDVVPVDPAGTIALVLGSQKYYYSDGALWKEIPAILSLPVLPKFGDVFFVTGEKKLYMYADGGVDGAKWMPISSSGIAGGGTADFPTDPKPGDLFFNTDNNTLYLFDATYAWVEVSTNGSTPAGYSNPDPMAVYVKEGQLFYNSSETQLYVYNGTEWIPVGNKLGDGQIFVGNSSNVAAPVPMSGDATISNTGKLTIKDKAITDAKLDKTNIPLSGFGNPVADISVGDGTNNYKITNLKAPSASTDAVTKAYVDGLFSNSGSLTLAFNNLFVGSALNKAVATPKTSIPLSGFGNPTANISMNGFRLTNLPNPPSAGSDAVSKDYVDNAVSNKTVLPININLSRNMVLVGNDQDQAGMMEKFDIPVSDFGAAKKDVSLGSFKITNLATPTLGTDAANKDYVDNKVYPSTNIALGNGNFLIGNSSGKAAETTKNLIPISGFGAAAADVSLGSYKITNLAAPVGDNDAVNKKYIEDLLKSPSNALALPSGNLFVGNATGKAEATLKNAIPVSGFGKATAPVYMGDAITQYTISNLANPMDAQDAATKAYVDLKIANPSSITLANNHILVGNVANQAEAIAKTSVPITDFGAAAQNLSLGNFNITNVRDPVDDGDAVNKKYLTTQLSSVGNLLALPSGQMFVGNLSGKAAATAKNAISLSDFGPVTKDLSLLNFKITALADPTADQEAATKKYVDSKTGIITVTPPTTPVTGSTYYNTTEKKLYVYDGTKWIPVNSQLPAGQLYLGDASGNAAAVAKNTIPLSGFGAPETDIAFGAHKITGLADPTADQEAATKKYVDSKTGIITVTPPTTPVTGSTYYNTTEKKLYVYDGTKWIPVNSQLPTGQLYVGDASGNASAAAKNTISLSEFGVVTKDLPLANFKITGLGVPTTDLDAANKKYVDDLLSGINNLLLLPKGNMLVGDASGKAASMAKSAIPLSGFGDAEANISLGTGSNNYKVINLADPTADLDAANKKYVDSKVGTVTVTPPTTPVTGSTYYNTTEKKLYVYDGTKWIPVNSQLPTGQLYVGDASGNAAAVAKSTISLSDFGTVNKDLPLANFKITNLADPGSDLDAANKKYVDSKVGSVITTPPTTPTTGSTYYNTTEKKLYVYDGTKWIPVNSQLPTGQLYVGDATGNAAATEKNTIPLSGFGTPDADIAFGAHKITGLADPTADQEAATKKYVDGKVGSVITTPPTTPTTGSTYYNTTENKLYVYDGTKWIPVNSQLPTGQLYVGDASGNAAAAAKNTISLSDFGPVNKDLPLSSFKITGLADPTADQEAATKKYVDSKTGIITVTPPTTPVTGSTYYNTTEKKLYVYDGTKWIPVNSQLPTGQLYVGDASGNAAAAEKNTISLSEFGIVTKDLPLANFKITGLGIPTTDLDAANKKYVDDLLSGINNLLLLPKGNMLVGDASGKAASVAKSAIPLSGFGDAEANISLGTGSNNYKVINLADPTADLDAANKKYVDSKVGTVTVIPPTTPVTGSTYYNTTEKKLYVYDGTKWIPVNSQLPTGQLYVGDASGNAAAVEKSVVSLSEFGSVNKDLPLSNFKITTLADPTADQDAANKKYVDAQVLNAKAAPIGANTLLGNNTASDAAPQALTPAQVKAMLALNNVDNTTDASKNVYSATKLTTPITINGVTFDGSTNITVPGDNLGNHTASQNIKTLSYSISQDGTDGRGLSFESSGSGVFAQDVTIKGNLYTPSDARLKTNIETLTNVLEKIDKMRGVAFEYKDQRKYAKGPKIGVIAQELQKVYPNMVSKGQDGYLKVDYTQLTAVLIQAVKEQQQRMIEQQLEINELKSRLDKQQQQINSILKKLE